MAMAMAVVMALVAMMVAMVVVLVEEAAGAKADRSEMVRWRRWRHAVQRTDP